MDRKVMYIFVSVGGAVGAYLPIIFGAGGFSIWSIIGSAIGGFAGIFLAAKIS